MNDSSSTRPPAAWQWWNNPIFRRYCRSRLRFRALGVSLIITLVLTIFFVLFIPIALERVEQERRVYRARLTERLRESPNDQRAQQRLEYVETFSHLPASPEAMYHRVTLLPLLAIQMFILILAGTGQVAGGMTVETDEGTLDYQQLTPMTPAAKVLGYLFGLPVREYVLVLCTLPFTAYCLWRGEVPAADWAPLALVFFTSVVLYHLTGLVAGTVIKSRRWAFLLAMGLVFVLYLVMPIGARFGFPLVRYITIWPVAIEHASLYPVEWIRGWRGATGIEPGSVVPLYHWEFSQLAFTLLVQGSFIVTLFVMVWRKWRRRESHLLSKSWACGLFLWIHALILGNALPLARDGTLFPSFDVRLMSRRTGMPRFQDGWVLSGVYGFITLALLIVLVIAMTPRMETQARGLRRARKLGRFRLPWFSDEASAFVFLAVLCVAGAWAWASFTCAAFSSGGRSPWAAGIGDLMPWFAAVLAGPVLAFHALLEGRGARGPFLASVFLGAVPIMAGLIVGAASRSSADASIWVTSLSPIVLVAVTARVVAPSSGPSAAADVSMQHAWTCWTTLFLLAAVYSAWRLRQIWRARKKRIFDGHLADEPAALAPATGVPSRGSHN